MLTVGILYMPLSAGKHTIQEMLPAITKMKNKILILAFILITSCLGFPTDWDVELWEQKIEESNLSIFKFDASGGRDSMISGMKIIDSNHGFNQSDVTSAHKFSYLLSIPNKSQINGIYRLSNPSIQDKTIPEIIGLKININGFQDFKGSKNSSSYEHFKFKSFAETRDSIIFYSNESNFVNGTDYDRVSIPKGNVYLMTSKDNLKVTRITCEKVIFIEGENSTETKIYTETKVFDPINEIKTAEFSNYGIYKPVK